MFANSITFLLALAMWLIGLFAFGMAISSIRTNRLAALIWGVIAAGLAIFAMWLLIP